MILEFFMNIIYFTFTSLSISLVIHYLIHSITHTLYIFANFMQVEKLLNNAPILI